MRNFLFTIFCCLSLILHAQEQENKPVFFEKINSGLTRFYFDKNYFLCPKDCEFKFIERVASFDAKRSLFNGEFKDFGPYGHVLLSGNYVDGYKSGVFKAYHLNQQLKWEVEFDKNLPIGEWKFYYPDGKPFLVLYFENGLLMLRSFWNQKGQQKVINGNGEYDFTMHFEEFTEIGFPSYRRKGKVMNGLPTGFWNLYLVDGKKSRLAREEKFVNGVIVDLGEVYYNIDYDEKQLLMYPIDNFYRAETLSYKNCNFDDHSGFRTYLSDMLKKQFPTIRNFLIDRSTEFEYQVMLDKTGEPKESTVTAITSASLRQYLQNAISNIYYYLPSYINNEYVNDVLTITGNLNITETGNVDVQGINIKRKSDR